MKKEVRILFESGITSGNLEPCRDQIEGAFRILRKCVHDKGKILVCGNGGSAADSEHIVGELMKGFCKKRSIPARDRRRIGKVLQGDGKQISDLLQQAIPAISLVSQNSLYTAIANDTASDMVFAQQVYGYGAKGDVLIAISTSGNSGNVINALRIAKALGMGTIALTGGTGGKMKSICDVAIRIPTAPNPEIQARHVWVYHTLCSMLEAEFFD